MEHKDFATNDGENAHSTPPDTKSKSTMATTCQLHMSTMEPPPQQLPTAKRAPTANSQQPRGVQLAGRQSHARSHAPGQYATWACACRHLFIFMHEKID
jgi:hypothetical protein